MNERHCPCNVLHDVPDLAYSGSWGQFGRQKWQLLRRGFVPGTINPSFEVQVAEFHVDKVNEVRNTPVIEYRNNVSVCMLSNA